MNLESDCLEKVVWILRPYYSLRIDLLYRYIIIKLADLLLLECLRKKYCYHRDKILKENCNDFERFPACGVDFLKKKKYGCLGVLGILKMVHWLNRPRSRPCNSMTLFFSFCSFPVTSCFPTVKNVKKTCQLDYLYSMSTMLSLNSFKIHITISVLFATRICKTYLFQNKNWYIHSYGLKSCDKVPNCLMYIFPTSGHEKSHFVNQENLVMSDLWNL